MANIPQIISGTTIVLGLLVLIASAIFLDQIKGTYDLTKEACPYAVLPLEKELCSAMKAGLAAAAIGIIVSAVQIFFGIYAVIKLKTEVNIIWKGIHALLAVLSIVCFAISIHFDDWYKLKINASTGYYKINESIPRFFSSMTIIDAIFCIVAIVLSFTMFKK